jgi:dolichyl-phosphate-mannose-protein mannosyltransferase
VSFVRNHARPLAAVLVLSAATRLLWFGNPHAAVIDEVYFGQYLSGYLTGAFTFDLHPPLGRMLVALFAKLGSVPPVPQSMPWDGVFSAHDALILRLGPLLFGSALPGLFYALAYALLRDKRAAFVAGAAVALDNALITQSRFLFFDVFLLDFGVASLLCALRYRSTRSLPWLVAAGALAGAAGSVKWTGLTFVVLPALVAYVDLIAARTRFRSVLRDAAVLGASAAALYLAVFTLHLTLMPHNGPGSGFLSPGAQNALTGSTADPSVPALGLVARIVELHRAMYEVNQRIGGHVFASPWYGWPLDRVGVGYFLRNGHEITLIGNDLLWWSASLATLFAFVYTLARPRSLALEGHALCLVGYLLNWLPFALISRVMFLHHYLVALLFSVLVLVAVVRRVPWLGKRPELLLVLVVAGYLYRYSLTYGTAAPW